MGSRLSDRDKCVGYLSGCALGIWIRRMGSRIRQREKVGCGVILRKFSANPMENSGTGKALNFSKPRARGSGLYTHITYVLMYIYTYMCVYIFI